MPYQTDPLHAAARSSGTDEGRRRQNTWQSVRADVLDRIRSGEWAPGSLIPTEQEMAAQMGCARATVNRALRELADSGIVQRRRKVGTRVTATPSRRTTLSLPVIRDEIEALGARYRYVMTECETARPTPAAMQALQVDADAPLLLIKAQYLADDLPHCCEALWLNPRALRLPERQVFAAEPAQEWLARSMAVTQNRFSILAEGASGSCARNLCIVPGTPVMAIERINSSDALPVSFARQFYPPGHRIVLGS